MRLDKWLWAARFYKTRALAVDDIDKGRVQVNGQAAKPSREVRVGDRVALRQGSAARRARGQVLGLSDVRGPAPVAQALYEETAGQHRRARGRGRSARLAGRAGASHRAGPPDQARPARTGRLAALERLADEPDPEAGGRSPAQHWQESRNNPS